MLDDVYARSSRASMFVHEDDRVGLHEGCLKMFMHVHPRASMFVHEDARVVLHKGCLKMFMHIYPRASMFVHTQPWPLALGPWPLALT